MTQIAITWDEPKRRDTLATRGLDFADLTPEFFANAIIRPAKHGRFQALGLLDSTALSVVFAALGTQGISVISMRRASVAERRLMP